MLVGSQQELVRVTDFCITARNRALGRVYEFKYLGVMLDPCLSWNDHIDLVRSSLERLVYNHVASIKFAFRYSSGSMALRPPTCYVARFSLFARLNTRNKDLLRLPLAKTNKYQSSFYYNGAKAWNDLPYKLRIENSFEI